GRYVVLDTGPAPRAWYVPAGQSDTLERLGSAPGDPHLIRAFLAGSRPLDLASTTPEHLEIAVQAEGPGVVVVSQLDYPEWRASWVGPDGRANPATIHRVLGGWQG